MSRRIKEEQIDWVDGLVDSCTRTTGKKLVMRSRQTGRSFEQGFRDSCCIDLHATNDDPEVAAMLEHKIKKDRLTPAQQRDYLRGINKVKYNLTARG